MMDRGSGRTHKQLMKLKPDEYYVVHSFDERRHCLNILNRHRPDLKISIEQPVLVMKTVHDAQRFAGTNRVFILDHHAEEVLSPEIIAILAERNDRNKK